MADKFNHPQLAGLSKNARAKVESALRETLDRELASSAVLGGGSDPVAAHSRSQGAFFSRSKTTDQILGGDDQYMIDKVATMDEEAFDQFASRLGKLKNLKSK